jgi:hypothetical protein
LRLYLKFSNCLTKIGLVKPLTIWSPDEIKSIYNNLLATLSLSYKMIVTFNVFCAPMKHRV